MQTILTKVVLIAPYDMGVGMATSLAEDRGMAHRFP